MNSNPLFEPVHRGGPIEVKKDLSMVMLCSGIPGQPETDRCSLHSREEFSIPAN